MRTTEEILTKIHELMKLIGETSGKEQFKIVTQLNTLQWVLKVRDTLEV